MSADPASFGPLDIRPEDFDWARFGRVAKGRPWRGRTVVVTGGTGFIGARLAHKLALYGASVTIPTRDRRGGGNQVHPKIRVLAWNPADPASVVAAVSGADTLFNLAYDFRRSGDANMALYHVIADAAASEGVHRFIHASSIAVYDRWLEEDLDENSASDGHGPPYKLTKRAIERDLQARARRRDFAATIIQPVNVYGPFSAMWTDAIVERIRGAGVVLPKGFDGLNSAVYVDDLVDAFIAAGDLPDGGAGRFIVAGPAPIPWTEIFTAYAEGCGQTVGYEDWPPALDTAGPAWSVVGALKGGLDRLVMQAGAHLAGWIGAARVRALRTRLAALRGGRGEPYRPVRDDPRFFLSRSFVHADRAATELCPPVVCAAEGLARTKSYIAWRFSGQK
jgi:dihydroflavonol-4-reductase